MTKANKKVFNLQNKTQENSDIVKHNIGQDSVSHVEKSVLTVARATTSGMYAEACKKRPPKNGRPVHKVQ